MNRVGLLIKKEMIYITTSLKSLLWMGAIFSLCLPTGNLVGALIVPVAVGYLFTFAVFSYEEKNKMNLVTMALPVTRKDICVAKYLSSVIYSLLSMVLVLVALLITMVIDEEVDINFLIGMVESLVGICLIYNGIILPLVIYFGTLKSKYFMFATYILAFGFLGAGTSLSKQPRVQTFIYDSVKDFNGVLVLLVGIMIYVISYCISLRLYQKKDFD